MQHDLEQVVSTLPLEENGTQEVGQPFDREELYREILGNAKALPMSKRRSPMRWRFAAMGGDGLVLLISLVLLGLLLPLFQIPFQSSLNISGDWELKLLCAGMALVSWGLAIQITRAQDLRNIEKSGDSVLGVWFALLVMALCWLLLLYLFISHDLRFFGALVLLFVGINAPLLGGWRFALAAYMNLPRFRPRGIIIGVNPAGELIASTLRAVKQGKINLLGYLSEEGNNEDPKSLGDLPVLQDRTILRRLVHSGLVDTLIIAFDHRTYPELYQEAISATQMGVSVIPMIDLYENLNGKIPVDYVGDHWYRGLSLENLPLFYVSWRKVFDLSCGLVGVVALGLVWLILAPLIYLDSPGPIFYRQERLGRNGRPFYMYKFRSMKTDAEREGRPVWANLNDERVTRIGRFMRATHLDELPQIWNILRGEMSLIGPRPERAEFVNELAKTVPFYRCRLIVLPGLTGWAQVKYRYTRNDREAQEKLQYDLYYIKNQSFLLDFVIILKTVIEVLSSRGV